ncbi:MAG: hypothetical protein LBL79_05095 [Prevotella sp.]|jgi:hypothetical protein|nr:hypothetical protein [Prevotella sp.]
MRKEIKELISAHVHDRLNAEERKYLRQNLSKISDAELTDILSDIWNNFENKNISEDDFDQITGKLRIVPQQKKKQRLLFRVR